MPRREYDPSQGAYPSSRETAPDPFLAHLRAIVRAQLPAIEATCATCGDQIMVPPDEDPEDTLCVACSEDELESEE